MKRIFAPLQQRTLRVYGMFVVCAMAAGVLSAQSPRPRITSEVTSSEMAQLPGSLHPLARAENDAGRMPGAMRLNGMSIYFNRSAAQQADLNALLAAQQDPSSPQYHQWLTPDQFGARFGMAQSDIDAVQTWLQQQGFSVDSVARSHTMIRFSGSVAQVESAFNTQMHYYNAAGVRHFAPSTALSVPAAIAPAVSGIRNLNDFRPHPQHVTAQSRPRPAFTSSQSGNVYFAPGDIVTAYDIKPLYSSSFNGSGQTIAVMGQSAVNVSDLEAFQSAAGLTTKDPTMVIIPGSGDSTVVSGGDEGESDLDLEWSNAMAPGADIFFVYAGNDTNFSVFDSVAYAVDEKIGNIISLSYDTCEPNLTSSDYTSLDAVFQQAATQGQSVFAASGDQGSTACFVENPPQSGDPTLAVQQGLAVNYPASSAYVTAVGGTEITAADGIDPTTGTKGASYSTYWEAQGSSDIISSLLKYIPEVAWNDDPLSQGVSAANGGGLSASGGGPSGENATFSVPRPSWQKGVAGIPSGSTRLVPDVSLYSSSALPGYLICTSDTALWGSSTQQASCNSGFRDSSTGDLTVAGGTSFATPIFAGMVAILNQAKGYTTGQGLINPSLYSIAGGSSYSSAFHDVTSGNNYCTAGSPYCASNGTTLGFAAGTGYDEVTGLGSVDLNNLATAWPAATGTAATLIASTTTVSASNSTPTNGQSVTFTITVAPASGSGVPTGTVNLSIDGGGTSYNNGGTTTSVTLSSNGTATYTTSFTASGIHEVVAQYPGDSTYAASTGTQSVSIATTSSGKGTFTLGATPSTLTVAQGSSGNESISITPAGGYTGTVVLNYSVPSAINNLCVFAGSGINTSGDVAVPSASPVTVQLQLDTNAADCSSSGTVGVQPGKHGMLLRRTIAGNTPAPRPGPNRVPAEIAFAGLVLAGFLGRHSRKLRSAAWVLLLAAAGLALSACGSSSTNVVGNPPKGTYTITLNAADSVTSTNTATATFTLTID